MMNQDLISFQALISEHPQLTEKALVDFVNGLEVTADHIRVQTKVNSRFFARTWSGLNGEGALRQNTINQHVTESLTTVSIWLENLQGQQIQSDLAIAKISNKLVETRKGLMILLERHQALNHDVKEILVQIDCMKNGHELLSARLDQVNSGRLATQHIEAVFDKWKAGRLKHFPVLARLFLVFDELYWGDFGNYCRKCGLEHREIQRLVQQVQDKSLIQLECEWEKSQSVYLWQDDTKNSLQNLQADYREMIAYLSDGAPHDAMPMVWGLNQLANSSSQKDVLHNSNLPKIIDMQNAIHRFSFDFEARYANKYS
jgi:hypothetical protein